MPLPIINGWEDIIPHDQTDEIFHAFDFSQNVIVHGLDKTGKHTRVMLMMKQHFSSPIVTSSYQCTLPIDEEYAIDVEYRKSSFHFEYDIKQTRLYAVSQDKAMKAILKLVEQLAYTKLTTDSIRCIYFRHCEDLSKTSQHLLHRFLESSSLVYILSITSPTKLTHAIRSRCIHMRTSALPLNKLGKIFKKSSNDPVFCSFAKRSRNNIVVLDLLLQRNTQKLFRHETLCLDLIQVIKQQDVNFLFRLRPQIHERLQHMTLGFFFRVLLQTLHDSYNDVTFLSKCTQVLSATEADAKKGSTQAVFMFVEKAVLQCILLYQEYVNRPA